MILVFCGTPSFAVPTLERLVAAGYSLPLVVTQPDRGRGRGMDVSFSPVKDAALRLGIEVAQPAAIKNIGRRPCQQAQDDHGQAGRGLHQGNEQGRRRQHRHQPGAGRILHPSAQVGHNGSQPQIAKQRHRKRFEAVELGFRLQLICF